MRSSPEFLSNPDDWCENPYRRTMLAAGVYLVALATTRSIANALQLKGTNSHTENAIEKRAESLVIPEDERTGQDILLTATYDEYVEINGENCLTSMPHATWTSILEKLPTGTNVMLLVPFNFADWCTKLAKETYPNLNITTYKVNARREDINAHMPYPQDIFFPTGRIDGNGRFIILEGTLDTAFLDVKYGVFGSPEENAESEEEKLFRKIRFLGDYLLTEMHPDTFVAKDVNIFCPGGDLQVVRLPDGKSAAIVGKSNIGHSCTILRYTLGTSDKESLSKPITPYELETIKRMYKKELEVDEVIFIDEQHIFEEAGNENLTPKDMVWGSAFFHSDMLIKTATDPKNPNRRLAFYNNIRSMFGVAIKTEIFFEDVRYLNRINTQFEQLGYEMVGLPCGPRPVLNYVNCTMFTRNGIHYVMVPQYGIPEDTKAVEIYKQMGFKVIQVDMSHLVLSGKDTMSKGGSVHCGMVVLK